MILRSVHSRLTEALCCLLAGAAVLTVAWTAVADPFFQDSHHCITPLENGTINWTTGTVTATGNAVPQDTRPASIESIPGAARADASRHLIRILKQIHIEPDVTVEASAGSNDTILAGIEKTARDATVVRQYYTSGLALEIQITASMLGGFLQLVLPEEIRQIPKINPTPPKNLSENQNHPVHTGLIIDARGLDLKPVLNPRIISEQGHDIYSAAFISRDFAVKNGVCTYACDMETATAHPRIGNSPLVFKGLRMSQEHPSAVVISMPDYSLLEKTTERHTFLKECRVIIVADP